MEALRASLSASATGSSSEHVANLLSCLNELRLDVQIASVGGVGTDLLLKFLNDHHFSTNLVTDFDNLKHPFRPAKFACGGGPRAVVYLFGNPLESVASHYRRGWAERQASKTGGPTAFEDFPPTFEEYVEQGKDLFGYEGALTNWLKDPVEYDILFVQYEFLFDHVEEFLQFVCMKTARQADVQELMNHFPDRRDRESQVTDRQKELMYRPLQHRVDKLPHCFVRRAGESFHEY
mmetsp:Transcript_5006/g.9419  ORF Transcript_5006/g.9419 Transcript_5006/m.9419 type:complete len:235 (-) Transcript_5006:162-866(-)